MNDRLDPGRLRERFARALGRAATGLAIAPGRVNLIGEHTDYNDGFVFPMAIDRAVGAAFAPRDDRRLRVHAVAFDETREIALDGLAPGAADGWLGYAAGVAWALQEAGHAVSGADLAIDSDVPMGSGLSSSAALELAVARALAATSELPWVPVQMARLAQRAESGFVGVNCGLMDQLASALGEEGHALLLDCRSLETRSVVVPEQAVVVVMDTAAPRSLAGSAYNERRAACEVAVAALRVLEPGIAALRDVDAALLERGRDRMDALVFRRASHVVPECRRPEALAARLEAGDLDGAGRLMDESHASLRDLYEVSCAELETMTALARARDGCFGARLTGAGFGGCAIALVEREAAPGFAKEVEAAYRDATGLPGQLYACRATAGARLLD
jgi:galactokinase